MVSDRQWLSHRLQHNECRCTYSQPCSRSNASCTGSSLKQSAALTAAAQVGQQQAAGLQWLCTKTGAAAPRVGDDTASAAPKQLSRPDADRHLVRPGDSHGIKAWRACPIDSETWSGTRVWVNEGQSAPPRTSCDMRARGAFSSYWIVDVVRKTGCKEQAMQGAFLAYARKHSAAASRQTWRKGKMLERQVGNGAGQCN